MTNEEQKAKFLDLESRLVYMDRLVETLNEVIIEQGAKIDAIERNVYALKEEISNLKPDALNEKPPHY